MRKTHARHCVRAKGLKIPHVESLNPFETCPHVVEPLTEDDGGLIVTLPERPGCVSDGENLNEAIANGRDTFSAWMSA